MHAATEKVKVANVLAYFPFVGTSQENSSNKTRDFLVWKWPHATIIFPNKTEKFYDQKKIFEMNKKKTKKVH